MKITDSRRRFLYKGKPEWLRLALRGVVSHQLKSKPFYEMCPYKGGLTLYEADLRTVVVPELNVLFNRIPKSANTSLTASIAALTQTVLPIDDHTYNNTFKRSYDRLSSLSAPDAREVLQHYYCFTLVRNPYSRVLSAFLDKVGKSGIYSGKFIRKLARQDRRALIGQHGDFGEFIGILEKNNLYTDHHWAPQAAFLTLPLERYDFVLRLESIEHDWRNVVEHVKPDLAADDSGWHFAGQDPKRRRGAQSKLHAYYDDNLRDQVYELYRDDFDLFGYDKELPQAE